MRRMKFENEDKWEEKEREKGVGGEEKKGRKRVFSFGPVWEKLPQMGVKTEEKAHRQKSISL